MVEGVGFGRGGCWEGGGEEEEEGEEGGVHCFGGGGGWMDGDVKRG